MEAVAVPIFQERRLFSNVEQEHIDIAGVVNVAKGGAAARVQRKGRKTGIFAYFIEGPVAIVAMKQDRLTVAWAGVERIHLRIDMAIGHEEVEPGVIVHVKESGAPAHVRIAGLANARSPTYIIETLLTHIPVERIRLLLEVRDEVAEAAAMIVVSKVHTHAPKLHAFSAESHSREHADVRKRAIVIVVVEIARNRIIGHEQVGPAVIVVVDPHNAKSVVADVIVHTGFDGDFLKCA